MLGRERGATARNLARIAFESEAFLEPGVLNQPGGGELHMLLALLLLGSEHSGARYYRETRRILRQRIKHRHRHNRVREERAGREGIAVGGIQHHPLGGTQRQHLIPHQRGFGTLPHLHTQALRQFPILNG